VDAIELTTETDCSLRPLTAMPSGQQSTTTARPSTTTEASILELDCDFEKSCAAWKNDPKNTNVNWAVRRANESQSAYAPLTDRTFKFLGASYGSYLTLDTVNLLTFSTVGYESPYMNGTKCIEFWYYIYGTGVHRNCFFLSENEIKNIQLNLKIT
jgi:hypothetical protein